MKSHEWSDVTCPYSTASQGILANSSLSSLLRHCNLLCPCRALLRCHPPPNQHKMGELSQLAAELGFPLDVSSSGALQVGGRQAGGRCGQRRGRGLASFC